MTTSTAALDCAPRVRPGWRISSSRKSRLAVDGAWLAVGQLGQAAATLVGMRLLTEFIAPDVFGSVTLLLGGASLCVNLFCLPLLQAALRYYPEAAARGDVPGLRRAIGRPLWRATVLMMAAMLTWGAVTVWMGQFSFFVFVVLAVLLALDVSRTLETNFLSAARRQKPYALWTAAEAWAKPLAAIAVIGLFKNQGCSGVLLGYLLGSGGVWLVFMGLVASGQPAGPGHSVARDSRLMAEIWRYALPLAPLALVGWVSSMSDRYIVNSVLGLEAAGIYSAAYAVASRPLGVLTSLVALVFRPVYFDAVTAQDHRLEGRVRSLWLWLTIAIGAVAVGVTWSARDWLLCLLVAQEYRTGGDLLVWIAGGIALLQVAYVYDATCYAYKRTGWILAAQFVGALLSVATAVVLIALYGLIGAAIAVPIYYAAQTCLSWYAARRSKLKGTP